MEHAVWSVVCFRDVKGGLRWQMAAWLTCCTCYITIFHDTKHDSSYFRNFMLSQKAVWSLCLFDGVLSSWRAMIVFVLREFRMSPFPFLPRRHTTIRLRTADKTNETWSEMKRRGVTPTLKRGMKRMTMRWKSQGNGLHRRSDTSAFSLRMRARGGELFNLLFSFEKTSP